MLFRPSSQAGASVAPTTTFSVDEMLRYRRTWGGHADPEVEAAFAKLAAPPPEAPAKTEPSAPLVVSDSGYRPQKESEMTAAEKLIRSLRSSLNKLTPENFEKLVEPMLQPALFEADVAKSCVDLIFDKSLEEPMYASLYATMCFRMALYEKDYLKSGSLVRKSIIEKAQAVFQQNAKATASDDPEALDKLGKRKIANMKFVGCLFRKGLLGEKVIANIVATVRPTQVLAEIDMEVILNLLDAVGDMVHLKPGITPAFEHIEKLSKEEKLYSPRLRFLMMNLTDLRKRGFVRDTPDADGPAPATASGMGTVGSRSDLSTLDASVKATGSADQVMIDTRDPRAPDLSIEEMKKIEAKWKGLTASTIGENYAGLATVLSDKNPVVNRMCGLYHLANQAAMSTDVNKRIDCKAILSLEMLRPAEIRAALSWVATDAILNDVSTDCPNFFERLAEFALIGVNNRAGYKAVVLTVFGDAAFQLDEIWKEGGYVDDDKYQFQDGMVDFWTHFMHVSAKHAKETTGIVIPLGELMDALAGTMLPDYKKRSAILAEALSDLLHACVTGEFTTMEALKKWAELDQHAKSQKLQPLVKAVGLL